jgi:hypothetical protein
MPLSGQPSVAINKPKTWAQRVKSQHNHTVQTVSMGTQTQDDHVPSTLQGITVNKFIELVCKIISLCKHSESLDITKTVTDLTKETLQSYSPAITCTNDPVSTGIVPQPELALERSRALLEIALGWHFWEGWMQRCLRSS